MVKLISLFNHKGGVSKTTTAFNLGWMLADCGRRVLLVDCDPQCNLTGNVLGFGHLKGAECLEDANGSLPHNMRDGLAPAFEAKPVGMKPVKCIKVQGNQNLFLLPGHIGLAEYEVTLGIAQQLSSALVTLRNLPGCIHSLVTETAKHYGAEIVLFDMSPNLGPINQNLWSISDYFIIPMHPDYFALMAIDSLSNVLPKWKVWRDQAVQMEELHDAAYPFPDAQTKYLGYVMQKFRPRGEGMPAKAFKELIDKVQDRMVEVLLPVLKRSELMLQDDDYQRVGAPPSEPILQMSDFNSLIAKSQEHQTPIFALTDQQLGQTGIVFQQTKSSMEQFGELFRTAAEKIISVINDEEGH